MNQTRLHTGALDRSARAALEQQLTSWRVPFVWDGADLIVATDDALIAQRAVELVLVGIGPVSLAASEANSGRTRRWVLGAGVAVALVLCAAIAAIAVSSGHETAAHVQICDGVGDIWQDLEEEAANGTYDTSKARDIGGGLGGDLADRAEAAGYHDIAAEASRLAVGADYGAASGDDGVFFTALDNLSGACETVGLFIGP